MADIYIKDFFANDITQYAWKWKETNIINMKKCLKNDEEQLKAFTKDVSIKI